MTGRRISSSVVRMDGVVGAADDAEEIAGVVKHAARAGRLNHLLEHRRGEVGLADARLSFEEQQPRSTG